MISSNSFITRVSQVEQVAENICAYTLTALNNEPLPVFTAGAHIDLLLENGMVRQCSLCGDPSGNQQYRIAVQLEEYGRGGSEYIHTQPRENAQLRITPPRNYFEIKESADNYLLIAGGIGITPIMVVAIQLKKTGKEFTLHYLCRTPEKAAFYCYLQNELGDKVRLHFSYGNAEKRLNLSKLFAKQSACTRVYTCGSEHLLQSILDAANEHASIDVSFERFVAVPQDEYLVNSCFEVELASTGEVIEASSDQSILDALRSSGCEVASMCEEGLCGSCETGLLDGEADHRDSVLNEGEKNVLMICCSRARSPRLKLDL